jgi:hypothetical protein
MMCPQTATQSRSRFFRVKPGRRGALKRMHGTGTITLYHRPNDPVRVLAGCDELGGDLLRLNAASRSERIRL